MFFEPNLKFRRYVVLIGLPALALAIVGGYSLREDRIAARTEATDRAERLIDELIVLRGGAELGVNRIYSDPKDSSGFLDPKLVVVALGQKSKREFPISVEDADLRTSWQGGKEDEQTFQRWSARTRAASDLNELLRLVDEVEAGKIGEELRASSQWLIAGEMVRFDLTAAAGLHERLVNEFAGSRLRSGTRLGVLSLMWLLEHPLVCNELPFLTASVGEMLLRSPDAFSSAQLNEIGSVILRSDPSELDSSELQRIWDGVTSQWEEHEELRHFYRLASTALQLSAPNPLTSAAIPFRDEEWLVWRESSTDRLIGRRQDDVMSELKEALRIHSADSFFKITAQLESMSFGGGQDEVLVRRVVPGSLVWPDISVAVGLVDPAQYYAGVVWRRNVFLGLILFSIAAVVTGLVALYRGLQRQQRVNRLRSDFVASVSHELRTPAASISLLSDELLSGANDAPHYHRLIHSESQRLSSLVENVLDVSRIERGAKQYEFENTDVRRLIASVVDQFEAVSKRAGVAVRFVPPNEEVDGDLDPIAIQRAIRNLLDNAIKYSAIGTEIVIGLKAVPETVTISVSDQGCGIDADQLSAIFQPFTRLGSELRRESIGVGLGLALTKHVVVAHHGEITVDSVPGKGSRFEIMLPRERNDA